MRKVRVKRISGLRRQVDKHENKIETEKGRLDTTKDYWKKEIDEKFLKQIQDNESYLKEEGEEKETDKN